MFSICSCMSEAEKAAAAGREELDEALFQRVVLANQYEMLASLRPKEADLYLDIAERVRAWWPLEDMYPIDGMREMREDPLTREDQDFVKDVLEIYDALQRADGQGLVGEAERPAVRFMGFCGNYELKYLSYLNWLRGRDMFLYVKLANPNDTNAHWPMVETYRRMLARWDELGRPRQLDAGAAAALLGERLGGGMESSAFAE